eukprot:3196897-Pyramimonas_sp.AAC.1
MARALRGRQWANTAPRDVFHDASWVWVFRPPNAAPKPVLSPRVSWSSVTGRSEPCDPTLEEN